MAGFDVRRNELLAAAQAGRSAAGQVGALAPGEALRSGAGGVPGAPVIPAMLQVAQRWQDALSAWQSHTGQHAESLAACVTTYGQADDGTARRLSPRARPL